MDKIIAEGRLHCDVFGALASKLKRRRRSISFDLKESFKLDEMMDLSELKADATNNFEPDGAFAKSVFKL